MDAYIGEIKIWPVPRSPNGWLYCNGAVLNINDYQPLYAVIGTTYGGDGVKTFALPNLCGRIPIHMGAGPKTNGTLPPVNHVIGQSGGTLTVTLTEAQIPSHEHIAFGSSLAATTSTPGPNTVLGTGASGVSPYMKEAAAGKDFTFDPAALATTGGNQPHNNVMPSRTVNYIICVANGVFPVKP